MNIDGSNAHCGPWIFIPLQKQAEGRPSETTARSRDDALQENESAAVDSRALRCPAILGETSRHLNETGAGRERWTSLQARATAT